MGHCTVTWLLCVRVLGILNVSVIKTDDVAQMIINIERVSQKTD